MADQQSRKNKKPIPTIVKVTEFIERKWGLKVSKVRQIDSYDDANFYCECTNSIEKDKKYLVKFFNALDTDHPEILDALYLLLTSIRNKIAIPLEVPTSVSSSDSDDGTLIYIEDCEVYDGGAYSVAVRIFDWIEGSTLSSHMATTTQLKQVGGSLVAIHTALSDFDHPALHRVHLWDLAQFSLSYPLSQEHVDDPVVRDAIHSVYREYQTVVLPLSDSLPRSVIMGDCNDANIIIREGVVRGLIDFSDAVHTWSVNEIAIAMAYALITSFGQLSPYEAVGALLLGYTRGRRLSEQELIALPVLIATRLSISISVGAYSISKEPENEYLKLHALPARKSLLLLWSTERKTHVEFFREVQEAGLSNGDFTDGMLVDIIDKHYK